MDQAMTRAKLTRSVDQIVRLLRCGVRAPAHAGASASQLPVFIVGMPRSGTSLTEQILASHPAVFGAGEVRFWDSAFAAVEKRGPRAAAVQRACAESYLARVHDASRRGAAGDGQDAGQLPLRWD